LQRCRPAAAICVTLARFYLGDAPRYVFGAAVLVAVFTWELKLTTRPAAACRRGLVGGRNTVRVWPGQWPALAAWERREGFRRIGGR